MLIDDKRLGIVHPHIRSSIALPITNDKTVSVSNNSSSLNSTSLHSSSTVSPASKQPKLSSAYKSYIKPMYENLNETSM